MLKRYARNRLIADVTENLDEAGIRPKPAAQIKHPLADNGKKTRLLENIDERQAIR
jgi:hypothetical protein